MMQAAIGAVLAYQANYLAGGTQTGSPSNATRQTAGGTRVDHAGRILPSL